MLLLVLQLASLIISYKITLSQMHSCEPISGFLGWQCSGNTDPLPWMYAAVFIIPPLIAKPLLKQVKIVLSWRKPILIHLFVLAAAYLILIATDSSNCGCGG